MTTEYAIFELIDLISGNVIDDFDNVDDALESICKVANAYGWPSVENLSLMRVEGDNQELIAKKKPLANMAKSLRHTIAVSRPS